MGVIVGSGEFRYEVIEGWGKLPEGWTFKEVAAVAVDKKDQVYCFTRGAHPIIVFDRDGNFLRSWGEGVFKRAHGATIGPRRNDFFERRRRSYGTKVHLGWKSHFHFGCSKPTGALSEWRAVQSLHACRFCADR